MFLSELDESFQPGGSGGARELERTHNPQEIRSYQENPEIHENLEKQDIREIPGYRKNLETHGNPEKRDIQEIRGYREIWQLMKNWKANTSEKFGGA